MRQLVTEKPLRLGYRDVPEPVLEPSDALLAIEAVGICGSDIHLFTGEHPYSRFPNVQGHEFAGLVLELPSDYTGPVRTGDRVAVEPLLTCGTCLPCRRGRTNCCVRMRTFGAHIDGALSERLAVPAALLHPANDLSAATAALAEPMSIGVHAVGRAALRPGDQTVVYGAGPIGQAIVLAAQAEGASVLVIDRLEPRLALAIEFGAARIALAAAARDAIADWTAGDGPVAVFEATGVAAVLREAMDVVAPSGTVVVVGLSRESVAIPLVEFTRKELSVVGSRNSAREFGAAIELVRANRSRVERLITHRFDFTTAPEAFRQAHEHPAETEKVIITMSGAA